MARGTVTLEGFAEVRAAVTGVPASVERHSARAVAETTASARRRVHSGAPVRTGRLRGAIGSEVTGTSGRVTISSEAPYWRHVEYGTRFVPAQPFVRTAAELEGTTLEQRVHDVGKRVEQDFGR